jgi:hypothetical protein
VNTLFTVTLTVQQVFQGPQQTFTEGTLAATSQEAICNIRERYRQAYQLRINTVKA